MRPERYRRATELFRAALGLDESERCEFLVQHCGEDSALRRTVEGMIRADRALEHEDSRFQIEIQSEDWDDVRTSQQGRPAAELPTQIGHYEVLGEIARGGMGIVLEARQKSPSRRVALKVLTHAEADPESWRRFEREAEALGRLRHPGLAQIFESGLYDDGRRRFPYIAMERVEGTRLDVHVLESSPDRTDRIELLVRIGDAVQHAHQRGIVHRDLKPANILVEADGQPKIVDFGIARFIRGASSPQDSTLVGQVLGTLEFMAPEQARGDPDAIDTRADVYALGAVAHVLLTGQPPIDLAGLDVVGALRAVAERQRSRLGDGDPRSRGDLQLVVSRALEIRPEDRYASVAEFVADLRRYLRQEPVSVRTPTLTYLVRRFAQRHRGLVMAVTATLVALVVGLATALFFLHRALDAEDLADDRFRDEQRARQRAQVEADRSHRTTRLLQDLLFSADPTKNPGGELTVRELLSRFASSLDGLGDPPVEAALRYTIGRAYYGLGLNRAAVENLRHSVRLHGEAFGPSDHSTLKARSALAVALRAIGEVDEAEVHYREAARGLERVLGPTDPEVISALNNYAVFLYAKRDLAAAHDVLADIHQRNVEAQGATSAEALSSAHNLAAVLFALDRLDTAIPLFEETARQRSEKLGADDPRTLKTLGFLAGALQQRGRYLEAHDTFERLASRQAVVLGAHHGETLRTSHNAARSLALAGRLREAIERERAIHRRLVLDQGAYDPLTLEVRMGLASALHDFGELDEAIDHYEAILAVREERHGRSGHLTQLTREALSTALRDRAGPGDLERANRLSDGIEEGGGEGAGRS